VAEGTVEPTKPIIILSSLQPGLEARAWLAAVHGANVEIVCEPMMFQRAIRSAGGLVRAVEDQSKIGPVYLMADAPPLQMGELGGYISRAERAGTSVHYGVIWRREDTPDENTHLPGLWHIKGSWTLRVWAAGTAGSPGTPFNDPLF